MPCAFQSAKNFFSPISVSGCLTEQLKNTVRAWCKYDPLQGPLPPYAADAARRNQHQRLIIVIPVDG